MSAGGGAAGGGHPDFGMSGVSVPGSSGFGEQRGFGNNVGPIGLNFGVKSVEPGALQHNIAHVQLGYNVPGFTEMDPYGKERAAMIDQMRHGMAVRSLTKGGFSPTTATNIMDAREFMSDQQERDYFSNQAAGNMMNANPHASLGDIAASIGSGNFTAAPHQLNPANPNYAPSIEMNEVLGLDLSQMDQDVLGLDRAMVSNYAGNPWGSVISNISHSDTEREYAERAAERALYSQIVNQITQAAGQSPPSTGTTVAGPTGGSTGGGTTGGGNTGGGTTGGGSTGGGTTGGGTTGGGRKPGPRNPRPPANDVIDIVQIVKEVLSPRIPEPRNPSDYKQGTRAHKDRTRSLIKQLLKKEPRNPRDSSYRAPKPKAERMDTR